MTNDLKIPIIAGTLTLIGGIVIARMNCNSQTELAQKRHDVDLIIKALESETPTDRYEMLQLLTEAHLLNDVKLEKKIADYATRKKLNTPHAGTVTVNPETGIVASPSAAVESNPIIDPDGTTFKVLPKVKNNLRLATSYEKEGFDFLASKNVNAAIESFTKSENSYNGFHMVYDIALYLKSQKGNLAAGDLKNWKAAYEKILKDYSWRMPDYAKIQLKKDSSK